MAHTTEISINGIVTQVTEFDHSAQEIDDTVDAAAGLLPGGTGLPVDRGGTGAQTPQEALANLGAGVRPNLGDNCDFTAPINQRGVTSWSIPSGDVPIFDRWKIQATEGGVGADLESGGLKLAMTTANQGIKQEYAAGSLLPRKVYTSSVMVDGKLYSAEIVPEEGTGMVVQYPGTEFHCAITFSAGQCQWYPYIDYRFTSRTVTIARCKLENDRGQTLGYMDADGTWKLLPQPDSRPGQMLAECQRYLIPVTAGERYIGTVTGDGTKVAFAVPIPATMRTTPAVSGALTVDTRPSTGVSGVLSDIYVEIAHPGQVTLVGTLTTPASPLTQMALYVSASSAYLSAEL